MDVNNYVACNGCTLCCQRDLIFLHPEYGDDMSAYDTRKLGSKYVLKHKTNGDCIYLDRETGCTIYALRPTVCRELDCRIFLRIPRRKRRELLATGRLKRNIIKQARFIQQQDVLNFNLPASK